MLTWRVLNHQISTFLFGFTDIFTWSLDLQTKQAGDLETETQQPRGQHFLNAHFSMAPCYSKSLTRTWAAIWKRSPPNSRHISITLAVLVTERQAVQINVQHNGMVVGPTFITQHWAFKMALMFFLSVFSRETHVAQCWTTTKEKKKKLLKHNFLLSFWHLCAKHDHNCSYSQQSRASKD